MISTIKLLAGSALALAVSTGGANAAWVLDADDIALGSNTAFVDIATVNGNTSGPGVDIMAGPGRKISSKTTQGSNELTIGTSHGVHGEIDAGDGIGGADDFLSFDFSRNIFLESLTLAFLYPDGEFGDKGNEVAVIDIDGQQQFYLEAQTSGSATIYSDFFGTGHANNQEAAGLKVNLIDLAIDGRNDGGLGARGGIWEIVADAPAAASLFGDFDTLKLFGSTLNNTSGNGSGSDFSFVSLSGAASVVPVPAALPLMATGLMGLALLGRRRKMA